MCFVLADDFLFMFLNILWFYIFSTECFENFVFGIVKRFKKLTLNMNINLTTLDINTFICTSTKTNG